jgi:hypothetical protein
MTLDVETPRIANATTEPEEHNAIEITPEMVEAGKHELERVWGDLTNISGYRLMDSTVQRVFAAMWALRH